MANVFWSAVHKVVLGSDGRIWISTDSPTKEAALEVAGLAFRDCELPGVVINDQGLRLEGTPELVGLLCKYLNPTVPHTGGLEHSEPGVLAISTITIFDEPDRETTVSIAEALKVLLECETAYVSPGGPNHVIHVLFRAGFLPENSVLVDALEKAGVAIA